MTQLTDLADIPQADLRLYRGDTAEILFVPTGADGLPLSLDGAVVRMQARRRTGSPVLFSLSTETGELALADGGIRARFDASLTRKAAWKEAVYDVEAAFAEVRRTLWRGKIELVHDITGD